MGTQQNTHMNKFVCYYIVRIHIPLCVCNLALLIAQQLMLQGWDIYFASDPKHAYQ
jgi:hypothetical protein